VKRLLEIRSYNLKPGTLDEFHRLVVEQSVPMLLRWGVDLVAFGPSAHDPDSYYLMRAYADAAERRASQDAFYGSDEWRSGPRQAILDCIESDATISLELDPATIDLVRATAAI
jgi:NIPSNAP